MKKILILSILLLAMPVSKILAQCGMTISIMGNTTICADDCTTLSASVSGGTSPYRYKWNPGGETTSSISTCPYSSTYYTVLITDSLACAQTQTTTVYVTGRASANSSAGTICSGQSADMCANGGGSYLWNTGSTAPCINVAPTATTTYSVIVSWGACMDTADVTLVVSSSPPPTVSFSPPNVTICQGGSATLCASGGASYTWSTASTGWCISVSPSASTTYSVLATNAGGCTAIGTATVYVSPFSPITTGGPLSISCGQTATLTATGGTSYSWSIGATTANISVNPTATTTYTVCATNANGCTSCDAVTLAVVSPIVINAAILDASCFEGSIDITVSNGKPPYTFSWSCGATTEDISNLPSGGYSVRVWDNSCLLTQTASFTVKQLSPGPTCGIISGKVFLDYNKDCMPSANDFNMGGIVITAIPGPYYSVTDQNGNYSMIVPPGTYSVSQAVPANYYEECPGSGYANVVVNPGSLKSNITFSDTTPAVQDLAIWAYSGGAAPGFNHGYYISCFNHGNTPANATAYLIKDPRENFVSATPYPASISGDTLFWNFTGLAPAGSQSVSINVQCKLPPNISWIGDTLRFCAEILPIVGDVKPSNNASCGFRKITASCDPNMKEVFATGLSPNGDILPTDTILHYTIHFQNTGTDTAHFIVIRDTLSPYLNPASVESGPGSHPYKFSMKENCILKWEFDNIMLPDSNVNEPASHGVVSYRIRVKKGLPLGTVITNQADIYFDYNLPVITNATINTIAFHNSVQDIKINDAITISPNPSSGRFYISGSQIKIREVEVFNLIGEKEISVMNTSNSHVLQMDLSEKKNGIYLVKIKTDDGDTTKKIIIAK